MFSVAGFFATWAILLLLENVTKKSKIWFLNIATPIGYGILLAVISDEMQLFASGRSGEFRDVLIDSGGYFLGAVIIFIILFFIFRKNEKRKQELEVN